MIKLYHVNFHTANNKPAFLNPEAEQAIRVILRDVMKRHRIPCILSEVMPTHVHLILIDFADMGIGRSLYLLKGASAHVHTSGIYARDCTGVGLIKPGTNRL